MKVLFLQACRRENIIPKGLRLKLKVHVGNECQELQSSIDDLLFKVSGDICDRLIEYQQRNVEICGKDMERVRDTLKETLINDELFRIDSCIHEKTEAKRESMEERHIKKLKSLKETRGREHVIIDTGPRMTAKKMKSVKKNSKGKNKPCQNQNVCEKSFNRSTMQGVSGTSKRTTGKQANGSQPLSPRIKSSASHCTTDASTTSSKNEETPGTVNKTYAEAIKTGSTLQETIQTILAAITNINRKLEQGGVTTETGDSYVHRTKRHGDKSKGDNKKYARGRKQF